MFCSVLFRNPNSSELTSTSTKQKRYENNVLNQKKKRKEKVLKLWIGDGAGDIAFELIQNDK